ncbi:hypothetical protein KC356_g9322 [Hortaea werneckii]|nr:hypothetical protein KC356_g9322 [Hortaea werneckii]
MVGRIRISGGSRATRLIPQRLSPLVPARSSIRAVVNKASEREQPLEAPSEDIAELIRKLQAEQPELIEQGKRQQEAGGEQVWRESGGLWYYDDRLYVPADSALHAQLMRIHHDDPLAGHFGQEKTKELLQRKYWWPNMTQECVEYVKSCQLCQAMKSRRHRPYGEPQALPLPSRPWQELSMDFITDLPPTKWKGEVVDSILVIVDRYSKMNKYIPVSKRMTSASLADVLRDEVIRYYGVPKGILTDRGSVFTSEYWSEFAYEAQVKRRLSTAFHPQTDGQTERMNQTLEQYLRIYCSENQEAWAQHLTMAEFAVNNSVHHALRMSPFSIVYGWHPEIHQAPTRDESHEERVPAAAESAKRLREADEQLREHWNTATEQQLNSNKARSQPKEYRIGDKVLLSTKNLRMPGPKRKMNPRFAGPFRIQDAVGAQAYRLALPAKYRIHNVFHVSLLEPWYPRAGEKPAHPMPLAEEDGEWEVEKIVDSAARKGKQWYLVKWMGWPDEYTSWQSAEDCANAQGQIAQFERTRRVPERTGRGARARKMSSG